MVDRRILDRLAEFANAKSYCQSSNGVRAFQRVDGRRSGPKEISSVAEGSSGRPDEFCWCEMT